VSEGLFLNTSDISSLSSFLFSSVRQLVDIVFSCNGTFAELAKKMSAGARQDVGEENQPFLFLDKDIAIIFIVFHGRVPFGPSR
jgi:hypothetical protein